MGICRSVRVRPEDETSIQIYICKKGKPWWRSKRLLGYNIPNRLELHTKINSQARGYTYILRTIIHTKCRYTIYIFDVFIETKKYLGILQKLLLNGEHTQTLSSIMCVLGDGSFCTHVWTISFDEFSNCLLPLNMRSYDEALMDSITLTGPIGLWWVILTDCLVTSNKQSISYDIEGDHIIVSFVDFHIHRISEFLVDKMDKTIQFNHSTRELIMRFPIRFENLTNNKESITGKSILLVDDQKIILRLFERRAKAIRYQVTTCSNPMKALELVCQSKTVFDYIFIDKEMPNMNGIELTRRLREEGNYKGPIYLHTGDFMQIEIQKPIEHVTGVFKKGTNKWIEFLKDEKNKSNLNGGKDQ